MKWNLRAATLLFLLVTLPSAPVLAHKAFIFAWYDGDKVQTKSKLSGGKPVSQGKIVVQTMKGEQILEGKTDAKGAFSFPLNPLKPLRIILSAGEGHRAEWILKDHQAVDEPATSPIAPHQTIARTSNGACEKQVLTSAELDKKLEPIYRALAELKEDKPNIRDILGGIGYIIGLVGLAAYFQSRKKQ